MRSNAAATLGRSQSCSNSSPESNRLSHHQQSSTGGAPPPPSIAAHQHSHQHHSHSHSHSQPQQQQQQHQDPGTQLQNLKGQQQHQQSQLPQAAMSEMRVWLHFASSYPDRDDDRGQRRPCPPEAAAASTRTNRADHYCDLDDNDDDDNCYCNCGDDDDGEVV